MGHFGSGAVPNPGIVTIGDGSRVDSGVAQHELTPMPAPGDK